jgi:hypothetical protein
LGGKPGRHVVFAGPIKNLHHLESSITYSVAHTHSKS